MKMVAASKLRRAQEAVTKPRAFANKLSQLMSVLATKSKDSLEESHPLLFDRPHKRHVCVSLLRLIEVFVGRSRVCHSYDAAFYV